MFTSIPWNIKLFTCLYFSLSLDFDLSTQDGVSPCAPTGGLPPFISGLGLGVGQPPGLIQSLGGFGLSTSGEDVLVAVAQ